MAVPTCDIVSVTNLLDDSVTITGIITNDGGHPITSTGYTILPEAAGPGISGTTIGVLLVFDILNTPPLNRVILPGCTYTFGYVAINVDGIGHSSTTITATSPGTNPFPLGIITNVQSLPGGQVKVTGQVVNIGVIGCDGFYWRFRPIGTGPGWTTTVFQPGPFVPGFYTYTWPHITAPYEVQFEARGIATQAEYPFLYDDVVGTNTFANTILPGYPLPVVQTDPPIIV